MPPCWSMQHSRRVRGTSKLHRIAQLRPAETSRRGWSAALSPAPLSATGPHGRTHRMRVVAEAVPTCAPRIACENVRLGFPTRGFQASAHLTQKGAIWVGAKLAMAEASHPVRPPIPPKVPGRTLTVAAAARARSWQVLQSRVPADTLWCEQRAPQDTVLDPSWPEVPEGRVVLFRDRNGWCVTDDGDRPWSIALTVGSVSIRRAACCGHSGVVSVSI